MNNAFNNLCEVSNSRMLMKNEEKNLIIKELSKYLNWREKIILKIFANIFVKVYNISRIKTLNSYLK